MATEIKAVRKRSFSEESGNAIRDAIYAPNGIIDKVKKLIDTEIVKIVAADIKGKDISIAADILSDARGMAYGLLRSAQSLGAPKRIKPS